VKEKGGGRREREEKRGKKEEGRREGEEGRGEEHLFLLGKIKKINKHLAFEMNGQLFFVIEF
jgi:hypothetical protein